MKEDITELKIAWCEHRCAGCPKKIKQGHTYYLRQTTMPGGTIRYDRLHPKCRDKEVKDG